MLKEPIHFNNSFHMRVCCSDENDDHITARSDCEHLKSKIAFIPTNQRERKTNGTKTKRESISANKTIAYWIVGMHCMRMRPLKEASKTHSFRILNSRMESMCSRLNILRYFNNKIIHIHCDLLLPNETIDCLIESFINLFDYYALV